MKTLHVTQKFILICSILILSITSVRANQIPTSDNVYVQLPEQGRYGDYRSLADSLIGVIRANDIRTVMIDINSLVGCLCNRYIHGDENTDFSMVEMCAFGAGVCMNAEFFKTFVDRLQQYNENNTPKVSLYGFDATSAPVGWVSEHYKIPEYKETTIVDSLERYCCDDDLEDIYKQAKRTEKMMQQSKKIKKLLGNEYPIWRRYIHALTSDSSTMSYRFNKEEIEESILKDFLWLNHRIHGKKLVICHSGLLQLIEASF